MKKSNQSILSLFLVGVMVLGSLTSCSSNRDLVESSSIHYESTESITQSDEESTEQTSTLEETTQEDLLADSSFPTYDLGGVTITLLDVAAFQGVNPDNAKKTVEKKKKQAWIDAIENKYNVTLEFVDLSVDIPVELLSSMQPYYYVADVMNLDSNTVYELIEYGSLYDMTQCFEQETEYSEMNVINMLDSKWGIHSNFFMEGLYYNIDMIEKANMEYTPAELFDIGKWSYEDFYNYCVELKSKLAEDEYAIYISPYQWMVMTAPANGVSILNGENLEYLNESFIEAMEFLGKLVQEGLVAIPKLANEELEIWDTWNYPIDTFDVGKTVAMAHRGDYYVGKIGNKFELGFVPYPWGSNVTIDEEQVGKSGAYLTLSENYKHSCYYSECLVMMNTVQEKGNPIHIMSMVCELIGWNNLETDFTTNAMKNITWLKEDTIDYDLYKFALERNQYDLYNMRRDVVFDLNMNVMIYKNQEIRSTLEDAYDVDMKLLKEVLEQ